MDKLIEQARTGTDDQILESLIRLGSGHLNEAGRMARAALVEVIVERHGIEFADALMDRLGL